MANQKLLQFFGKRLFTPNLEFAKKLISWLKNNSFHFGGCVRLTCQVQAWLELSSDYFPSASTSSGTGRKFQISPVHESAFNP